MSESNGNSELKKTLFGEWQRGQTWRRNLEKTATYKALDIAEAEDVNLSVNKSTGIGNVGLIGAVAAAGLGPAILGLALLFKGGSAAPPAAAPGPADANYSIRFYDRNGKLIDVPNVKELQKAAPKE